MAMLTCSSGVGNCYTIAHGRKVLLWDIDFTAMEAYITEVSKKGNDHTLAVADSLVACVSIWCLFGVLTISHSAVFVFR